MLNIYTDDSIQYDNNKKLRSLIHLLTGFALIFLLGLIIRITAFTLFCLINLIFFIKKINI